MLCRGVDEFFIDFVGDHQEVMRDGHVAEKAAFVVIKHPAGWIMRGIDQQRFGSWGYLTFKFRRIEAKIRSPQLDADDLGAAGVSGRRVAIKKWCERDDLVARSEQPL